MASQGGAATSRLAQMQMKFQKKQMQEREQRRIEMTGEVGVVSNETTPPGKAMGNGKVRQMFDERRRGAGIDRSNPLKPIMTTTTTTRTSSTTRTNGATLAAAAARRPAPIRAAAQRRTVARSEDHTDNSSKNSFDASDARMLAYEHSDNLEDETFPKGFSSLSLAERQSLPNEMGDRSSGSSQKKSEVSSRSSNSIKLKPVMVKKSPPVTATAATRNPSCSSTSSRARAGATSVAISKKPAAATVKPLPPKKPVVKMATPKAEYKPPAAGMATCRFCNRNFNEDRLAKHEQVCQKMASSRRRIFDASKHRVQGTEAEKYQKRQGSRANTRPVAAYTSAAAASGLTPAANSGLKKNNWRKKHEEFIAAIRAAKQVQVHLARGGKLSDLPPPPPAENPDYVQCPHCLRRFNETAAERHIPKCATMLHNKPKPGAGAAGAKKR